MRGLDDWISRGHERQDSDPDPVHPDEQSLLESVDDAIARELSMAQAYDAMTEAVLRKIRAMQATEDEAKGQWLAERQRGRGR